MIWRARRCSCFGYPANPKSSMHAHSSYIHLIIQGTTRPTGTLISLYHSAQSKQQFSQNPDFDNNRFWLHATTMMNQCALASYWSYSEFQCFKLPWSRLYLLQQYTIIITASNIVASTLWSTFCCCGREWSGHCSTQVIKLMTLAFEFATQYP
jgi:hypothetical protein